MKFELDSPIDSTYWKFISKLLERETELSGASKFWKLIHPYLMRFFIQYNYQFNLRSTEYFTNPKSVDTIYKPLFDNAHSIISLVYLFSHPDLNEIIICLTDFFRQLKNLLCTPDRFFTNPILNNFTNEIFSACHEILLSCSAELISLRLSIPVQLCFLYFNSHCSIFGVEELSLLELQNMLQTLTLVPRIELSFFQSYPEVFVTPLVDGSTRILNVLHNFIISPTNNDAVFKLGIEILSTYTHLCKIDNVHIFKTPKYSQGQDVAYFILWCLDRYPINELGFAREFHEMHSCLIPPEVTRNILIPILPDYKFIDTPTFAQPVKTVSQLNEETASIHEVQLLTDFQIPGVLISKQPLYMLVGTVLNFLQSLSEADDSYLKLFIEISLDILSDLFLDEPKVSFLYEIDKHNLSLSYLYFLVCIFNKSNPEKICSVFVSIPAGFTTLMQPIVFAPSVNKWVENNEYFDFIFMIRNALIHFLSLCFRTASKETNKQEFDRERVTFLLMGTLYTLFVNSEPQIFDEVVPLFLDFIHVNVGFFIKAANHTGIFEMFMKHMFDLQILHICLHDNDEYKKYLLDVEKSRYGMFRIFDDFLRTEEGKIFFFGNQQFAQFLIHLLFESSVSYFAADLIKRCVMLNAYSVSSSNSSNQFKIIFRNISELIKNAIGNVGDIRWVQLILVLVESLKEGFAINRNAIFSYLKSQQILLLLSRLPLAVVRANPKHFVLFQENEEIVENEEIIISDEDSIYMKIFELVFDIFISLSRESATFAESLASSSDSYYENITTALKMIKFGTSLVDRLLTLVFEQPISILKLPSTAQIRNYYALPFLFNSTTHLPCHPFLIHFLAVVCTDSVSNKLRVFQAHLPEIIIGYLQNFPVQHEAKSVVNDSIAESLHLFSIISQYVFSVPTLFRCIQAMRLKDNARVWWTGQLLSLFSTYIENSAKSSPCAFFYLDGRHTGFFLPEISASILSKGWSFMCRFELDSFGSNIGVSPVLLYLKFQNGDSFSISFVKSRIRLSFDSFNANITKSWKETIDNLEIRSNTWYDLIFSSDFQIFVASNNGEQSLFSTSIRRKLDLKQGVQSAAVGNVPPRAASEAPLVANVSAFYFFTGTITAETATLLISLPLSFVFGFSPSELKLEPRLPFPLFDGDFDSRLFLGINARMTDRSTCFNIAKKSDIVSVTFRGVAFPFSTSFVDITNYSGGVKLFLPLFDQVNLQMYKNEERKDNSSFLMQLISMLQSFFQRSKSLEADFVRSDGFKAISYSLMKIHPQHFTRTVLCSLYSMSTVLAPEFRSIMIDDIWLNFNIWKRLPEDIQMYLYDTVFSDLKRDRNFREHVHIGELCAIIAEQPIECLRRLLWILLKSMAEISFSNDEQDSLFSFLFLVENVPFQLEALTVFHELCSRRTNECCSVFRRKRMFSPFLHLLSANNEEVRLISLRIIFLIFHCYSGSFLPDHFDTIVLKCVHQLKCDEGTITNETWRTIQSIAFIDDSIPSADLRFVLPVACSCAHFFEADQLQLFQISLSTQSAAKGITDCSRWYFWLLYFTMQSGGTKTYNFLKRKYDSKIFGSLFEYMALNDKLDEPMFFFEWLCFSRRWNTMHFLNLVLRECISLINRKNMSTNYYSANNSTTNNNFICSSSSFMSIVFEAFCFMFYIPNSERYAANVQLYAEHSHEIKDDLLDEIESRIPLREFMTVDADFVPQTFVFSMRVNSKNIWIDKKLALTLISFIANYSERNNNNNMPSNTPFTKIPKTKLSEIFSFLISNVIQVDKSTLKDMIGFIIQFFSQKAIDPVSLHLLTTAFVNVAIKNPDVATILNTFYRNYNIMFNISADFSDLNFCKTVLQDYGPDIATWLDNIQGFSANVSEIYKLRFMNYYPLFQETVSKYTENFVSYSNYTTEMEDNNVALKRKQRRNRSIAAKVFRRFTRSLTVNGGPWCDSEIQSHWKLSPRTDVHFRHLFMRPNWNFDIHRGASLRRDQMKNEQAKLEYQRWIEMQADDQVSNEFSLEDIEDQQQPARLQYQFSATLITISAVYDGSFSLNKSEICFDGVQAKDEYLFSIEGNSSKTVQFKLSELVWVLHRSYLHIDRGLEFFCDDGRSYFFYFLLSDRNQIIKILSDYRPPNLVILQRTSSQKCFADQKFTEKWLNKEMSTYDYLMTVNLFAGRSFHDLSQYPVFPWIISDYTSDVLDIKNPNSFRDLSRPIGALNEKRLAKLRNELLDFSDEEQAACLYRCHYSTAYYVLLYMIRMEPFTTMHISMQDDKFDHPNRLFTGISRAWTNITSTSNDYRELIPEFFSLPEFLTNSDKFDLGLPENDGNVILPKWAKTPASFISQHRAALESEYVGRHIGTWIDLIFGFKQSGTAAVDADNTFHPYCYASLIDSPQVKSNHELLYEIQKHAGSFGIIPRQLFSGPHPNRPEVPLSIGNFNGSNNSVNNNNNNYSSIGNNNNNGSFRFSQAFKTTADVLSITAVSQNSLLFAATADATLWKLKPSRTTIMFESSSSMPFGVGKCVAMFPKQKLLVVTSPSGDAFHTFSFDYLSLAHVFSFRQQFSSLTALVNAGNSILVVLSQDGSLTVWDFLSSRKSGNSNFNSVNNSNNNSINNSVNSSNNNNSNINSINNSNNIYNNATQSINPYDPIYKVNHHLVSAVDATASEELRLIVSCDISRRIVLTELTDGSFIRSFSLPDESAVPMRVLILEAGYIVSFCEHRSHNDIRSTIQINALDSATLAIYDHPRRVTACCPINLVDGKSFLAVGFEDGSFIILAAPDASSVYSTLFPSAVVALSFQVEGNLLFLANTERQIYSLVLDL